MIPEHSLPHPQKYCAIFLGDQGDRTHHPSNYSSVMGRSRKTNKELLIHRLCARYSCGWDREKENRKEMTRQYDFHRSNESSQKDDDNWILQRSAVRQPPAKTLTPQTESTAGDRSGMKLDLMQIPVSNYSANPSPLQALAQSDRSTPVQRQEEEKKAENKTGFARKDFSDPR